MKTTTPSRQSGFSMIEVMLSLVLLSYAIASIEAFISAGRTRAVTTEAPVTARRLANEIHVLAKLLPRESSGSLAAQSAAELQAFDSLHGAVFSPPILANMQSYDALGSWTQEVSVQVVSLADPKTATLDSPTARMDRAAENVFQLTVRILDQGQEVDTFSWWVNP